MSFGGFYEMRFYDVRGGSYNGILEGVGGVSHRKSGVKYGGDRQNGIEYKTTSGFFYLISMGYECIYSVSHIGGFFGKRLLAD
jgi:hypothetical protein